MSKTNHVIKLQEKQKSLDYIVKILEYDSIENLIRDMNKNGYIFVNGKFIKKDIIREILNKDDKEKDIKNNLEEENINISNKEDLIRTTICVNKKVWENFNNLCNNHKEIYKQDLISQAIDNFVKKYS